jgi:primosomal protein N' (replication factor Y)
MHSNLTPAARRKAWQHILAQQAPHIVIGPRSALFTPLHNIGLIVIDEAHDQAYKQEQTPYYQASRVAAKLAELHHAQLVLGTATPPITDYYTFYEKKLPIIPMTSSAIESIHAEPSIVIVDQKDRGLFTRSPWLSTPLIAAIEENINSGEQSLIFLNRRGTARVVLCQACGWQALCPRCDLPLTYHGDTHLLQCHTCGFHQPAFSGCPDCDSPEIIFKSIGTKSLIDELHRLFPDARLLRLDSDNTKSESLGSNYGSIHSGEVDIIVGTQMIAKGLDLPLLNLVGIVAADTSLSFPDYTSEERTYQLISQVKGRVGRGHRAGRIILQTYQPESPTLATALRSDYLAFYQTQLLERKQFGFPPFYFMLKLTCDRASSRSAQKAAEDLAAQLRKTVSGIEIIGPSPSYSEKRNNRYYWQLIIKAKQRAHLIEVIHHLPANWSYDIDPSHLL